MAGPSHWISAALVAATIGAGVANAGPLPSLDGLIAFKNPRFCREGPALNRLVTSALVYRAQGQTDSLVLGKLKIPPAFAAQVGKPSLSRDKDFYQARIPLKGTWHGLPVRDLTVFGRPASEGGFEITFYAPKRRVLEVVNAAGFALGAKGWKYRAEGDDIIGTTIQVFADDGRGVLSCADG